MVDEETRFTIWSVCLSNDDRTPMSFVVKALMNVFDANVFAATAWMMQAHETDTCIIGSYTRDIAATKASALTAMGSAAGYELSAQAVPRKG